MHQVPLETLLAESDFVVCLVVANEQTENLMNRRTNFDTHEEDRLFRQRPIARQPGGA
jgi:phosphoglycerate dehydrogenase-like enzyme